MRFLVITLFPEMLELLKFGIIKRAVEKKLLEIICINPRDYADNKAKTVDDTPFGGGPGMLMRVEPLHKAIMAAKQLLPGAKVIYLSPQGRLFRQTLAKQGSALEELILIAGRYEGIDQRVIDDYVDEEWSIGDFVISGGELAACVIIDAIARCIPGVVGDDASVKEDSFYEGLLKYPQYTRPSSYLGNQVPAVLQQGNHRDIARWRNKQSLGVTWLKRPDLLEKQTLSQEAKSLLDEFIREKAQQISEEENHD